MSKKNNYNSIVFLTTLSVYLGLVLVSGATPTVAQNVNNITLNCSNLEQKTDDLGNLGISDSILYLVKDLRQLAGIGKFKTSSVIAYHLKYYEHCLGASGAISGEDQWASVTLGEAIDKINFKSLCEFADIVREDTEFSNLGFQYKYFAKYELNTQELKLTIAIQKFSETNAKQLAETLNQKFAVDFCISSETTIKQIYENTKATSENNQVFIVTRLPRGSLNALLAKKDAQ